MVHLNLASYDVRARIMVDLLIPEQEALHDTPCFTFKTCTETMQTWMHISRIISLKLVFKIVVVVFFLLKCEFWEDCSCKKRAAPVFLCCELQDPEGPQALCDLCLAQVCCSLEALCSKRADGSMSLIWAPLFPPELADRLLQTMASKGRPGRITASTNNSYREERVV